MSFSKELICADLKADQYCKSQHKRRKESLEMHFRYQITELSLIALR